MVRLLPYADCLSVIVGGLFWRNSSRRPETLRPSGEAVYAQGTLGFEDSSHQSESC